MRGKTVFHKVLFLKLSSAAKRFWHWTVLMFVVFSRREYTQSFIEYQLAISKEKKRVAEQVSDVKKRKRDILLEMQKDFDEQQRRLEAKYDPLISSLDSKITQAEKAKKTTIKKLQNVHNYLCYKSNLYKIWHENRYASALNITGLFVFVFTSVFCIRMFYIPMLNKALADAKTCVWIGASSSSWDDASNWNNCLSATPGEADYLSFSGAPTNNLVMTSNKTVSKVEALTASNFSETFDTNNYSLNVNGPFTWQKGTLTTGSSEITISGDVDLTAGTFNYDNSNIILSGSASNLTTASNLNFYDLEINKTANSTATTIQTNDFNVRNKLIINKGSLTGNSRTVTMSVDNSHYYIGDTTGGSATIKFTATGFIDATGGVANDTVNINGSGKTVSWNGSATTKFVTLTDGTLNLQSGKLSFPASADGVAGKLACASGKTLNIAGGAIGSMVVLRSQTPGSTWYLDNACGTNSATFADVRDSNNTSGTITATNSIGNSQNNTGWSIADLTLKKWASASSSDFGTAGNWSPSGVPETTDVIYFGTASSNVDCVLDTNRVVAGIINPDYSGTFSTSANNYSLTTSGLTWNSGTLTAGTSSVTINGATDSSSGAITSSGTIISSGANATANFGRSTLTNLTINKNNAATFSLIDRPTIFGTLTLTDGLIANQPLMVQGNVSIGANFDGGETINVSGSASQTIASSGGTAPSIKINKSAGTFTLSDNLIFGGDLRVTSGAFNSNTKSITFVGTSSTFRPTTESYSAIIINKTGNADVQTILNGSNLNMTGTITLTNGQINSSFSSAKDITIVSTFDGGSGSITLNGTGTQTLTLSSGIIPSGTLTINKSSGKVIITGTSTLTGDITLTSGTLEFASGYTYTVVATKTITTASGTALRFAGTAGNLVTLVSGTPTSRWNIADSGNVYANYVSVTDSNNSAGTIYAMNSSQSNSLNWDTTSVAKTWDGGGGDLVWNTAGNWSDDTVPEGNDTVVLDVASTITTSSDINFGTLTIGGVNATTLLLTNNLGVAGDLTVAANGTFEQKNKVNQKLSGTLLVQNGGVVTHTANGNYTPVDLETSVLYRLNLSVGSDITVDSGGVINVNGKGYTGGQGPGSYDYGHASHYQAAIYGGRVRSASTANPSDTYGDFNNPVSLGSGSTGDHSCGAGGGAAILSAGGNITANGSISSDGSNNVVGCSSGFTYNSGSGGSVNLRAGNIYGTGNIYARGGATSEYTNIVGGGGGRISMYNTNHIEFAGNVSADGQTTTNTAVTNANYAGLPGTVSLPVITRTGDFVVGTGTSGQNYIKYLVLGTDDQAADYSFGTLTVKNDGILKIGGNPMLAGNHGATDPADNQGSASKIAVGGATTIEAGGQISADGTGFGVGAPTMYRNSYGGHGQLAPVTSATYGSITNPTSIGSGAGAVLLEVNGVLTVNGSITADSQTTSSNSIGLQGYPSDGGGSVNIKALGVVGGANSIISAKSNLTNYGTGGRISLAGYGATDLGLTYDGFLGAGDSGGSLTSYPGTVHLPSNVMTDLHIGTSGTSHVKSMILGTDDQAVDYTFGDLHILSGGTLEIGGNKYLNTVNGLKEGTAIRLLASNMTVDSGGTLSANNYGFRNDGPSGARSSYGGCGGDCDTFGSITDPNSLGVSARYSYYSGGAIIVVVSGTLTHNGTISSSAADGFRSDATGGTVNISATTLAGSGNIYANGSQYTSDFGAGSGGRIAIKYTNGDPVSFTTTAYGGRYGSGFAYSGGAGTIYTKSQAQSEGNLIIKSLYIPQNTLIKLTSEKKTYDNITVSSKGVLKIVPDTTDPIDSTVVVGSDITLTNTAKITFASENDGDPTSGRGASLSATNISVASGTAIESNGQGYVAQSGYSAASIGKTSADTNCGGGGGYGGAGGAGNCDNLPAGGGTYGASNQVAYIGSGGGKTTGGAGGGYFRLVATTITNAGTISSNGNTATVNGGGGSGGGMVLESPTITNSGTISANGGAGQGTGGGGGGGRIFAVTNSTITAQVNGGAGGAGGGVAGSSGSSNIQHSPAQVTAITPAASATDQSQVVAFTFSTTDADGDYLRYKFELADDSGFATNLHTFTQGADEAGQTVTDNSLTLIYSGQNTQSSTAYSNGSTATATISSSTPLVQAQPYYWRVSAIDPGGVDSYDGNPHYSTPSVARLFTVAVINKTSITVGTGQTIRAASTSMCSSVITFEVRNSINEAVKLRAGDTSSFNLSSDSGEDTFYTAAGCSGGAVSSVSISVGSSSASFYYKSTQSRVSPFTITVSENPDSSWADATTTIQVNPGNLDDFSVSNTYPASRTADQYFSDNITVTAYDSEDNVKFDYFGSSALIWFTSSTDSYQYPPDLPAKSSSKYQFVSGDAGQKTFLGSTFRLKQTGNHTIVMHHNAFDSLLQDAKAKTSSTITINPGALTTFYLEDYPASTIPSWNKYGIAGYNWNEGGSGAPYNLKVTTRDQFKNTKTNYHEAGSTVWFELYTASMEEATYEFTYGGTSPAQGESTAYTFTEVNAGIKTFNTEDTADPNDPVQFISESAGKNMVLRVTNGSIETDYPIYIKPLGLDRFSITTTPILSKSGVSYDQANDTSWSGESGLSSVTVTAYDLFGSLKQNYGFDVEDEDHIDGEGYIYFWSPERDNNSGGVYLSNQEFPYYKQSAVDSTNCFAFPASSAGAHTFVDNEVFKFFKGGRRKVYVSECITPDSAYAIAKDLKDPHLSYDWGVRANEVKVGLYPTATSPDTIAVQTHVPGSTHENDQHTNNSNNNIIIGPGDTRLNITWQNPFDAPVTAFAPKIHIYQSTNGTDYSELTSNMPSVNGAGLWQSEEIDGLTNDQQYWYKLKLGYKRTNNTEILSDYSNVVTNTPKAIAPVDVTLSNQCNRDDANYPGQVQVTYKLRFPSTVSFSYFNSSNLSWNSISSSAVSGDNGALTAEDDYNFDDPILHTSYLEMNTDFDGQYLNGSFKVRVNVSVANEGGDPSESYSESKNLITLDTKNPASASLKVNATNESTANLTISATDDSLPIKIMVSTDPTFTGLSWEDYTTTMNNFDIAGASTVYIKFCDNYNNITSLSNPIRSKVETFEVKDASNIITGDYRLVIIWHASENSSHYNVWRSTDGLTYTQIKEVTDNGYLNIGLSNETTYAYKVTSEDSNGNISLPAGPVSSRPGSAPDVTQDPTVELFGWRQDQGVRAKISWNTDQNSTSYVAYSTGVLRPNSDNTSENGDLVKIVGAPNLTASHEIWLYNLEPQTKYYLKAFSANDIQIIGYSNVISFETASKVPLLIKDMSVTDIEMSSAVLSWQTSKQSTTLLEYGTSSSFGSNIVDSNFNTDHTFKLENLQSGTKYYFRIKAVDSDGNETISDQYSFETPATPIVSSVSVKEASYVTATIEWTTNVNCDSNVKFGIGNLSGMQGQSDSTNKHSVTVIGLEPKTVYNYRARSMDKFGNVAEGTLGTFTTSADTVSPKITDVKSRVVATGTGDQISYQAVISWTTDEPSSSKVEYATGISGDYLESTDEDASLNSTHVVILTELKPNSSYHFRVVSKDKGGNQASSQDNSIITPPKEKSLIKMVTDSLAETFSWVPKIIKKWKRE